MDQTAFGDFYRRTSRSLWSYVYRVTDNAADADDIVQEAFCRLLGGGPDAEEEQWRRYLFRIASNLVVDRWRRQSETTMVWASIYCLPSPLRLLDMRTSRVRLPV
jgi:RNA polymerase sigma factor (sigma-70 family)